MLCWIPHMGTTFKWSKLGFPNRNPHLGKAWEEWLHFGAIYHDQLQLLCSLYFLNFGTMLTLLNEANYCMYNISDNIWKNGSKVVMGLKLNQVRKLVWVWELSNYRLNFTPLALNLILVNINIYIYAFAFSKLTGIFATVRARTMRLCTSHHT